MITRRNSKLNKRLRVLAVVVLVCIVCYYYRHPIYHWGYSLLGFLEYDVPTLQLASEPEHIEAIELQRKNAVDEGWITVDKTDLVPTKLITNNKIIPAKYRLKGDYIEHVISQKYSYRIQAEDTIFGIPKFSLHHPIRRNNVSEFLWQFACSEEGLIRLDYDIIRLKVNEQDLGLYAMEEHFGTNFCSRRNLTGIVLRFEEKEFWEQKKSGTPKNARQSFESSPIDSYNTGMIRKDSTLWKEHEVIMAKLYLWRAGIIPTSSIFDPTKLAKYFALSDLCSGHHAIVWHNMRFYYRPETGLLEPIAYDGDLYNTIQEPLHSSAQQADCWSFSCKCLSDPIFEQVYINELNRISGTDYYSQLLNKFEADKIKYENILKWEFPRYSFDDQFLRKNTKTIINYLEKLQ